MVVRPESPSEEALRAVYEAVRRYVSNPECYHTKESEKSIREDRRNIFIGGITKNGRED